MPWKCPACHLPILHNEVEDRPRPGAAYRCHICRLELVLDPKTDHFTVAPMRDDEDEKLRR
jgi:hypothetical protein